MGNRIQHGTLVANTVTTIELDADYREVEVLNRDGSAEIYVTADGSDPTVEGDGCECVPAAIGAAVIDAGRDVSPTTIKLISTGTPTFSVSGS